MKTYTIEHFNGVMRMKVMIEGDVDAMWNYLTEHLRDIGEWRLLNDGNTD